MYTNHIILTSLFIKRQRNKDKTTAMRKGKPSLCLLAGKTVNCKSKCCWSQNIQIGHFYLNKKNICVTTKIVTKLKLKKNQIVRKLKLWQTHNSDNTNCNKTKIVTKLSWRQNAIFTLPKIYKTQSVTKLYLGQHSNCAKTKMLPKLNCN